MCPGVNFLEFLIILKQSDLLYDKTSILLDSEGILFGVSILPHMSIIQKSKDVLGGNIHCMEGIRKEGFWWDLLISIYFG